MQIVQLNNTTPGISTGSAGHASAVDETTMSADSDNAAPSDDASAPSPSIPLRAGLSNWDHQLQGEIASAQQALSFLDQSAAQLQALKSELAARLASRSGMAASSRNSSQDTSQAASSDSTDAASNVASSTSSNATSASDTSLQASVQQFSDAWKQRQATAGGSLDAQLSYTSPAPASQRFTIRGLTMSNLQAGAKEVLNFSVSGATQALSSVSITPGLSQDEIVQRFNQALAPASISASIDASGAMVFSTPEGSWATVRDTLSVRGGGIRFPSGQMNRVKVDPEAPAISPDSWSTGDTEALRQTLQQVVQALAQVQQARTSVSQALANANGRVASVQTPDADASGVGMDRLAQNFSKTASAPGYDSLLSLTSALIGISRDRVVSLLSLR
jgi:hypothetical protein